MAKFDQVKEAALADARERGEYLEGDEHLLALEATCFMHMAADAGRPSDAMRSVARSYLRDPVAFREQFKANR